MPPSTPAQTLLSPAELAYLHASLSAKPPIRPDLRSPRQFRPLVAETDLLPSTNGSARVCFSDGTEAIVGVKAEVEKFPRQSRASTDDNSVRQGRADLDDDGKGQLAEHDAWIEVSIEMPGIRDDDSLPVFLSSMLTETLLSNAHLRRTLYINSRWRWRLYVDVLLLSAPLSYPLPLLSLTTHLALLDTRLPRRASEQDDDPLFDDDWDAAEALFPRDNPEKPPITLLVMTVGDNILFDPSREELAVAEGVVAVSMVRKSGTDPRPTLIALRMIDPPSRLTPLPNTIDPGATIEGSEVSVQPSVEPVKGPGSWAPPRGGVKRGFIPKIIKMSTEAGGVGEEVLEGLRNIKT